MLIFLGAASSDSRSPDYVQTLEMGYEKSNSKSASTVLDSARYESGLNREEARIQEAQGVSFSKENDSTKSENELSFQIVESTVVELSAEGDVAESTISKINEYDFQKKIRNEMDLLNTEVQSLRSEKGLLGKELKLSKFQE